MLLSAMLFATPAHAAWQRATTSHFIVFSEGKTKEVREFAEQLERYDALLRQTYRVAPSSTVRPVTVFRVATVAKVKKLTNLTNIAGAYIPRAAGAVAFVPKSIGDGNPLAPKPEDVLFHEYAHHFLLQHFPGIYPAWFVEGFADFHSTTTFDREGRATIGAPALPRARALMNGLPMPAARLFAERPAELKPEIKASFYARAWLLTHFLAFEPGREGQLNAYLGALSSGKTPAEAQGVFGDLAVLDRALDAYRKRPTFSAFRNASPIAITGAATVAALDDVEAETIEERAIVMRGLRAADGGAVIESLKRAVQRHPDHPATRLLLAEAQIQTGDVAGAEASADAVLATKPGWPRALLIKGQALLGLAARKPQRDATEIKMARSWIVKANRADTEDPLPLVSYYRSFALQGVKPPDAAIEGLRKALDLAPQASDIRLQYALAVASTGDRARAARILEPLVYAPHGGAMAERTAALVASLRSTSGPLPNTTLVKESGDDAK